MTRTALVLMLCFAGVSHAADVRKFHLVDASEVRLGGGSGSSERTLVPNEAKLSPEWSSGAKVGLGVGLALTTLAIVGGIVVYMMLNSLNLSGLGNMHFG